jgi:hypothetical protein
MAIFEGCSQAAPAEYAIRLLDHSDAGIISGMRRMQIIGRPETRVVRLIANLN